MVKIETSNLDNIPYLHKQHQKEPVSSIKVSVCRVFWNTSPIILLALYAYYIALQPLSLLKNLLGDFTGFLSQKFFNTNTY